MELIGVAVAILVQSTKKLVKQRIKEEWQSLVILATLAVFSLLAGAVMYTLDVRGYMESVMEIIVYASATWALVLRRMED